MAETVLDPVSKPYAEALFALADEAGTLEPTAEELDGFVAALSADPRLNEFFNGFRAAPEQKAEMLDRVLGGKVAVHTLNFLKLLAKRGRFWALPDIRTAYGRLLDIKLNRVRARLLTAAPPGDAELGAVRSAIRDRLGKDAVIETVVDPDLLGGFVLQVGDTVVDASVAQRLRAMRRKLLDRAAADIHTRADQLGALV